MVGRLLSYWGGLSSGAMLLSGRVFHKNSLSSGILGSLAFVTSVHWECCYISEGIVQVLKTPCDISLWLKEAPDVIIF